LPNDHDRRHLATLEDLPEFVNQLRVIDLAEARRVLSKLGNRLCDLCPAAVEIAPAQVVKANSRLNQSLVKKPERPLRYAPQIFPPLVGLEVAAGVEKIYSFDQEIHHR